MILLAHIVIALASIGLATNTWFRPSRTKLRANYGLIAATVASGTYLLVSKPSHMLETCTLGLAYILATGTTVALAHRKLANQKIE